MPVPTESGPSPRSVKAVQNNGTRKTMEKRICERDEF